MSDLLFDPWASPFMVRALLALLMVSLVCAVVAIPISISVSLDVSFCLTKQESIGKCKPITVNVTIWVSV